MLASYAEPDMVTMNQLKANRLNAQKSTGPRTPAGKETSRFNALKHGVDARHTVIPGENQADLELLAGEYQDQLCPATAVERYLVDTLITSDWLRRRLHRAQAELYSVLAVPAGVMSPLGQVWQADAAAGSTLQKVFRQLSSLERSYLRALTELRRVTEERNQPEPEQSAEPAGISPSNHPQIGGLGFVTSTPGLVPWLPVPDPDPLIPKPTPSAFGRLKDGEPIAVRR